jgi:hypothetical protein
MMTKKMMRANQQYWCFLKSAGPQAGLPSDMPNIFLFSHVDLAEALYTIDVYSVMFLLGSIVSVAVMDVSYTSNMVGV